MSRRERFAVWLIHLIARTIGGGKPKTAHHVRVPDAVTGLQLFENGDDLTAALNTLINDEGACVMLHPSNADFDGPNEAIYCRAEWTRWRDMPFYGDTVGDCFADALDHQRAYELRKHPRLVAPAKHQPKQIILNHHEIESGVSRVRNAEILIELLPETHDGRNGWLLNYGVFEESIALRKAKGLSWDDHTQAAQLVNGS